MFEAFRDATLDLIEVHTTVQLPGRTVESLVDDIAVIYKVFPRRSLELVAFQVLGPQVLQARLVVDPPRAEDDQLLIDITAECERFYVENQQPSRHTRSLARRIDQMEAAQDLLLPITRGTSLRCTVRWFLEYSEWSPMVSPPLMKIAVPGTPYRQISGVRLPSGDSLGTDYATLDMETEDTFSVSMGFTSVGSVSRAVFNEVSEKAQPLRNVIVTHEWPSEK